VSSGGAMPDRLRKKINDFFVDDHHLIVLEYYGVFTRWKVITKTETEFIAKRKREIRSFSLNRDSEDLRGEYDRCKIEVVE